MSLVKVYTDIGEAKPVILIAKIFKKVKKNVYQIKYLSPTTQKCNGHTIFAYENAVYEVDEDSITEHLNTDNEEVVGFKKMNMDLRKSHPTIQIMNQVKRVILIRNRIRMKNLLLTLHQKLLKMSLKIIHQTNFIRLY